MTLAKHFPALQVLLPFFAALFSALGFHKSVARFIAIISTVLCLIIGIYALPLTEHVISYAFGDWPAPVGIEYRIDYLNQPVIIFINGVLLFFLIFGKELINKTIINYIDGSRQHLFYSILLFAHAGYLGVISTNDLFNLYVFIEISSLATYVLMSKGNNPGALIGAFDYLMLGTIGATLILIGIGFFLALTGSLNITDIANILSGIEKNNVFITATVFFLVGAILKVAFFPMHFWMMRAYYATAPIMLTYLAAISTIIGVYIIMRFMYFTLDQDSIFNAAYFIIKPLALVTIIICTFLALKAKDIKRLIIYSTASQIGYVFLLLTIESARHLMSQLLILDSINKIAMFTLVAHIENQTRQLSFSNFPEIEDSNLFKILAAFILMFSSALPLTSMFIIKVQIYDLLITDNLMPELLVVLFGGVMALLYHLKLAKALFFSAKNNGTIIINTNLSGLILITGLQIVTLFCIKDLGSYIAVVLTS